MNNISDNKLSMVLKMISKDKYSKQHNLLSEIPNHVWS